MQTHATYHKAEWTKTQVILWVGEAGFTSLGNSHREEEG